MLRISCVAFLCMGAGEGVGDGGGRRGGWKEEREEERRDRRGRDDDHRRSGTEPANSYTPRRLRCSSRILLRLPRGCLGPGRVAGLIYARTRVA